MDIRSKIWLEVEGEPVFGRGRRLLLEAIDVHGSINRAAQEIEISYRKAWSHISAMEDRLGLTLVERRTGGRNGGGAVITGDAKTFLQRFEALEREVRQYADERFADLFRGNGQGDARQAEPHGMKTIPVAVVQRHCSGGRSNDSGRASGRRAT